MSSTTINNPEPSANTLSHQKVSRLTSTALFAALICVTTAYIFHIPAFICSILTVVSEELQAVIVKNR